MNNLSEGSISPTQSRSTLPLLSWPLIIGILAFAAPLVRRWRDMIDPDTFMHIAAGRWMLEHRALPFHDPFSQAMAGAAWVPHEWLAELLLALVYVMAGWPGLVLMTAGCFGLSLGLFARCLRPHVESFSLLFIVFLTLGMAEAHLLIRPHVLAFPILVTWSGALIGARDAKRSPPFWLLPLMTLWANLHGGFMFGLALAAYLAGEAVIDAENWSLRRHALQRWGIFLLLGILAALVTPNGLDGFLQPFRLMRMETLKSTFVEWQPPNLRDDVNLVIWILGAMALSFGLGLKLPILRLPLLLGLFYETFQSTRHGDLLCWVGPLAVAPALGPAIAARIQAHKQSALSRWMACRMLPGNRSGLMLAVVLIVAISVATLCWPLPDLLKTRPVAALAAARDMRLDGPVLNDEGLGGYLIFIGIPPLIDGRIEMYGDEFLKHYASAEHGDRKELVTLLDRYHATWTLFPPDVEAVQLLDLLPGWRRAYTDEAAVIHVRDETSSPIPVVPEETRNDRAE